MNHLNLASNFVSRASLVGQVDVGKAGGNLTFMVDGVVNSTGAYITGTLLNVWQVNVGPVSVLASDVSLRLSWLRANGRGTRYSQLTCSSVYITNLLLLPVLGEVAALIDVNSVGVWVHIYVPAPGSWIYWLN